jgi:hypothetical protein
MKELIHVEVRKSVCGVVGAKVCRRIIDFTKRFVADAVMLNVTQNVYWNVKSNITNHNFNEFVTPKQLSDAYKTLDNINKSL